MNETKKNLLVIVTMYWFVILVAILALPPFSVAADGNKLWNHDGMPVAQATQRQEYLRPTTDGDAGAIIESAKGKTIISYIHEDGQISKKVYDEDGIFITQIVKGGKVVGTSALNPKAQRVIIQLNLDPIPLARMKGADVVTAMANLDAQHRQFRHDIVKIERDLIANVGDKYPKGLLKIRREYFTCFNGLSLTAPAQLIEKIKKLSYVIKVHKDREVKASLTDSISLIHADEVWNNLGATGDGVVVSVIDTGVDYLHPDLGGGFGQGYKVLGGYDFCNEDDNPMDDHGHGTHCAGIVAANGVIKGVAPGAKLMAFKVLNEYGWGYTSDIMAGIERSLDPDQKPDTDDAVDIITMSLGAMGGPDDAVSQAVDNAFDSDVLCVVAAGNNYGYHTIDSPGCARKALTVGASDKNDVMATFSSKGPSDKIYEIKPDVTAPGVSINSIWLNEEYRAMSGTSMATPHVAGEAALLLQLYPTWTPQILKAAIMHNTEDLSSNVFIQGTGRIDAYEAAQARTIIYPATLSLGIDDITKPTWTKTDSLFIKNISESSQTYKLSISNDFPAGVSTSISPESLTLNPGDTKTLIFEITVDNTAVPMVSEEPYAYVGCLIAQSVVDTLKIPFAFIKSPLLNIHFDEEPWIVIVHNQSDKYWWLPYPGNFLSLLVPEGTYDVMVLYTDVTTRIVREGIAVNDFTTININKSEAIHDVTIVPRDEKDDDVFVSCGMERFIHEPSGIGSITTGGFHTDKHFSDVSADYLWEWGARSHDYRINVYQFNDYAQGISSDLVQQNDPADLKHLTYQYHVDPDTNEIFVLHWISQGPVGGWSTASYNIYDEPLTPPYIQEAHYMPPPYPEFFCAYNYKEVYRYSGSPFDSWQEELLYRSPYLMASDRTAAEGYLLGEVQSPVFSLTTEKMDIGLSPPHWFGKFENFDSEVRLKSSLGCLVWLYTTQMSDLYPHNNLPYELYQDGTLVDSGTFSGVGNAGWGPYQVSIPVSPGRYTLKVPYNNKYYVAGQQGNALINAAFNTQAFDKDPPFMAFLNILSNGESADTLFSSADNEIRFTMEDEGGLSSVSVYYHAEDDPTWKPVCLSHEGSLYTAQLETVEKGFISLRIRADDNSGNTLNYELEPAFLFIEVCEGDFDTDGDVDGSDLAVFAADFGRTDCTPGNPCPGDFDTDGDIDGSDLAVFAADFGRTDCDTGSESSIYQQRYSVSKK